MLLTNGGGYHESERAKHLSNELDIEITEAMIVQSHSPFEEIEDLKDKTVLVLGGIGDSCRGVAEQYVISSPIVTRHEEAESTVDMVSSMSSLQRTSSLPIHQYGRSPTSSPTTTRTNASLALSQHRLRRTTLHPHSRSMLSSYTMIPETGG